VKNGDISVSARQRVVDRLESIGHYFDDIVHEERRLPLSQRQGTTMVLAVRHWMFDAFARLERRE